MLELNRDSKSASQHYGKNSIRNTKNSREEEMNELQEQLAQSRGGFTTQEKYAVKELMVDAVTAAHHKKFFERTPHVPILRYLLVSQ